MQITTAHLASRRGASPSDEISAPFWREPAGRCSVNGATYAGHPTLLRGALANLEILDSST